MMAKEKTKDLAYIRKQIRDAITWYKIDEGMPHFWTTENYKGAKYVKSAEGIDYPYYVKSDKAIQAIAERIFNKLNQ